MSRDDLFATTPNPNPEHSASEAPAFPRHQPLAARMRPRSLHGLKHFETSI